MIESVYSNDNAEANRTGRVQTSFGMPKNIRQVGKGGLSKKVYIEDYVMTFIKQLAGENYSACHVAVLVGRYIKVEQAGCIFISGAVEVEDIDIANHIMFTNDHWTAIYENIKKYFADSEIVGWFLGGPGYLIDDKEPILKAHIDNFAGQDKTLLLYDNMEKEEAFYFYENGNLGRQDGYYIYYEKNEEMQNYMIERKEKPSEEEKYDDKVSRDIRTVIQHKKPEKPERLEKLDKLEKPERLEKLVRAEKLKEDETKGVNRLMYAAGTLLAVIILVVGAAMLSNYDQMKNMQSALNNLTNNLKEVESAFLRNENDKARTVAQDDPVIDIPVDIEGRLDVEMIPGGVSPLPVDPDDEDAQGGEKQVDSGSNQQDETDDEKDSQEVSSTQNQGNASAEEVKYYTVKAGDSLAGISYKLYNSANYISVIKKLNNIEDEDMIYIGQKLIVP